MIPRLVIGSLSQRGTIKRYMGTKTLSGGTNKEWSDVATVWLHITAVNGREQVFGMQVQAGMTHVVVMRYREIDTKMKLVINGIDYNIRSIDNVEYRGRKLILGVERGVAI